MNLTDTPTVFIVDDDASVRDGMAWLLRTRRLLSVPFKSAESFLDMLNAHIPPAQDPTTPSPLPSVAACILLDVRMPGMSGLALFEHLLLTGVAHAWPVIFLTGHADVPTAVDTVKRGAFDFCEKPFSDNTLVDRVEQALGLSQERLTTRRQQQCLRTRLSELTEREHDVMHLVLEGLPNKLIADQLDISVRTVEVHRARVFEKMDVKSAVELANLMRLLS
jgi:two-component system response regulator DctR